MQQHGKSCGQQWKGLPCRKGSEQYLRRDVGHGVAETKENVPPSRTQFPPAQSPEKQRCNDDEHEAVVGLKADSDQGDAAQMTGESLQLTIL